MSSSVPGLSSGSSETPGSSASSQTINRSELPDRNVSADTIEDAYVQFIFYCNPGLPVETDVESLREAFRNPPKSGGKAFGIFAVYELVRKFYDKEIKTWTELTTTLGVEPPDPTKEESSQKVAQYGVRLKKWMNSMHVKSFFEYLMGMSNSYWTQIPYGSDPTTITMRDGVDFQDDMALRALLPHIRPKRGRKRPEVNDDNVNSPARRQRLSPSSAVDEYNKASAGPWSAAADPSSALLSATARHQEGVWGVGDPVQSPLIRWPNSAITPATRQSFWDENLEPRSAITPSKPKLSSQRRGAKNVSSAWKPGSSDSGGKTRGRPPIQRAPPEAFSHPSWGSDPKNDFYSAVAARNGPPPPPMQSWESHQVQAQVQAQAQAQAQVPMPAPPVRSASLPDSLQPQGPRQTLDGRPARPSISLQVPERQGGTVRLATPPPVPPSLMVNGALPNHQQHPQQLQPDQFPNYGYVPQVAPEWGQCAKEATDAYEQSHHIEATGLPGAFDVPDHFIEMAEDRTNVDVLMAFFGQSLQEAEWFDPNGRPAEPAAMDECQAIVNSLLQNMLQKASSMQAFLLNLAALAGAKTLMTTRARCARLGEDDENYLYSFNWEYRFGSFKGQFSLGQRVPRRIWQRPKGPDEEEGGNTGTSGAARGVKKGGQSAAEWQRKYTALQGEMQKRDGELADLRAKVNALMGGSSGS